jgi:hypothetical protein
MKAEFEDGLTGDQLLRRTGAKKGSLAACLKRLVAAATIELTADGLYRLPRQMDSEPELAPRELKSVWATDDWGAVTDGDARSETSEDNGADYDGILSLLAEAGDGGVDDDEFAACGILKFELVKAECAGVIRTVDGRYYAAE